MSNLAKHFFKIGLTFIFIGFLSIQSIKAQYINVDRVGLNNGLGFSGTIIENQKPNYLIICTDDYGDIKTYYKDIKYVLFKPNPNNPFYKKGGHQYFSAGLGYGAEYAGTGLRVQLRIGRKIGFAHFIGLGFIDVKRDDKRVYEGGNYSHSESQGTYKVYNLSTGLKFYPLTYFYFGIGIQAETSGDASGYGLIFAGIDYPIFKFLLINASFGYHNNEAYKYPIKKFMLNFGISYKLTTNPVKSD